MIYDGLVYVVVGQDPEHGEGAGRVWCIDPTRRGDVSAELAVRRGDGEREPIPHRKLQAVEADNDEEAVQNPDSAVVWQYERYDRNSDGRFDLEEEMHRGVGSVAIKRDLLFVADLSGIFHCINAKTGNIYWTYDMLAYSWGSPLIADDKVYIGDEDGDVLVFELSATPGNATADVVSPRGLGVVPLAENLMPTSVYTTPIVAGGVLYISTKSHLFAIAYPDEEKKLRVAAQRREEEGAAAGETKNHEKTAPSRCRAMPGRSLPCSTPTTSPCARRPIAGCCS